ncbi:MULTISPECIES: hypothetical protein [Hymenobacter]|uniref:hypothetical protein n=1 Tax=Hymenobacter TaxID=89966 RepID=UPI001F3E7EB7|nr:hypothetical protein [Hymenobacter sp. BT559]
MASPIVVCGQVQALRFGKVVDGRGKVLTDAVVLVRADRIVAVGPAKDVSIPPRPKPLTCGPTPPSLASSMRTRT